LHIDKVGSIKVGKDADIVLWNNNPLSIYAKAEKTLLKELFIMTWKKDELQGSNRKRTQRVNRSITTRENKGANTQEPKEKRKKNTIVIVKNFNKMSIKNHNYLKITDK
jgi:hypothetical protein